MTHIPTEEELIKLTLGIMMMLEEWKVADEDQIVLLGLPEEVKPRHMQRYRKGTPLPNDEEVMSRVEQLIAIYDALRTSFPRNTAFGAKWLVSRNRYLNNVTPMEMMLRDGLEGMHHVRGRLDCTVNWI